MKKKSLKLFLKNLLIIFTSSLLIFSCEASESEDVTKNNSNSTTSNSNKHGYTTINGRNIYYISSSSSLPGNNIVNLQGLSGRTEFLVLGGSNNNVCKGNAWCDQKTTSNTYFNDGILLKKQGWIPICARGNADKQVEIWARQIKGISKKRVILPAYARAYSYLRMNYLFNLDNKSTETILYKSTESGSNYRIDVPKSEKEGFKILGYFHDDSVELTNVGEGTIVNQSWGFGDGDGLSTIIYEKKSDVPSNVQGKVHDKKGGKQFTGILLTIN